MEIKVERDESLDRDGKDFSKQNSEKSSSKGKRKHKVWDLIANFTVLSVMLQRFPEVLLMEFLPSTSFLHKLDSLSQHNNKLFNGIM